MLFHTNSDPFFFFLKERKTKPIPFFSFLNFVVNKSGQKPNDKFNGNHFLLMLCNVYKRRVKNKQTLQKIFEKNFNIYFDRILIFFSFLSNKKATRKKWNKIKRKLKKKYLWKYLWQCSMLNNSINKANKSIYLQQPTNQQTKENKI